MKYTWDCMVGGPFSINMKSELCSWVLLRSVMGFGRWWWLAIVRGTICLRHGQRARIEGRVVSLGVWSVQRGVTFYIWLTRRGRGVGFWSWGRRLQVYLEQPQLKEFNIKVADTYFRTWMSKRAQTSSFQGCTPTGSQTVPHHFVHMPKDDDASTPPPPALLPLRPLACAQE